MNPITRIFLLALFYIIPHREGLKSEEPIQKFIKLLQIRNVKILTSILQDLNWVFWKKSKSWKILLRFSKEFPFP